MSPSFNLSGRTPEHLSSGLSSRYGRSHSNRSLEHIDEQALKETVIRGRTKEGYKMGPELKGARITDTWETIGNFQSRVP